MPAQIINAAPSINPAIVDNANEIKRRQLLAQQLMAQAKMPDSNDMVSGIVVKHSPLEYLAKALTQGVAGYQQGQADNLDKQQTDDKNQKLADGLKLLSTDPNAAAALFATNPALQDTGIKVAMDALNAKQQEAHDARSLEMVMRQLQGKQTINPYATINDAPKPPMGLGSVPPQMGATAPMPPNAGSPVMPNAIPDDIMAAVNNTPAGRAAGPNMPPAAAAMGPPAPVQAPIVPPADTAPKEKSPYNEDFLKTMADPAMAAYVKQVALGKEPGPKGTAAVKPEGINLLRAVHQYYPGYDGTESEKRQKVINSFTSGIDSRILTPINTASDHMEAFSQLAEALNNGDVNKVNLLKNALASEMGDADVTNVEVAGKFLAKEIGKALVPNAGSAGEREDILNNFATAKSWKQLEGAVNTGRLLLNGQINSMKTKYVNGTHDDPEDFYNLLTPTVQDSFRQFEATKAAKKAAHKGASGVKFLGFE